MSYTPPPSYLLGGTSEDQGSTIETPTIVTPTYLIGTTSEYIGVETGTSCTPAPVPCPPSPCPVILGSDCVFYSGDPLSNSGINTQDTLTIALQKLDSNLFNSTGLEAIDEGNGIGYRIIGRDPANYGPVGLSAIDMGWSNSPSTTKGATGQASFTLGDDNTAAGYGGVTFGAFHNISEDGAYSVLFGYGQTAHGYYSLGSGYNNLFTINSYASTLFGSNNEVRNTYNFGSGSELLLTGFGDSAFGGHHTLNSFNNAFATGRGNNSTGAQSITSGAALTNTNSWNLALFGSANVPFTGSGSGRASTDQIFVVGNGTYTTPVNTPWVAITPSNALELYRSGLFLAPSLTTTLIDGEATGKVLVTKEWVTTAIPGAQDLQSVLDTGFYYETPSTDKWINMEVTDGSSSSVEFAFDGVDGGWFGINGGNNGLSINVADSWSEFQWYAYGDNSDADSFIYAAPGITYLQATDYDFPSYHDSYFQLDNSGIHQRVSLGGADWKLESPVIANLTGDTTLNWVEKVGTWYVPLSVNGEVADATGDITIPVGDVTKVGTPETAQIGVWTGDGTIKGESSFTLGESASAATLNVGKDGVLSGVLNLHGQKTGTVNGGQIVLHTADDYDTNVGSYNIYPQQEDLRITSGAVTDILRYYHSTSKWRIPKYGAGTLTGTPTYSLAVDVDGNIIEEALGSTLYELIGVAASLDAQHLVDFDHVDITHTNRAVLDLITDAGSGLIITDLERTTIGDNTQSIGIVATALQNHEDDLVNPHQVTYTQTGAEQLGVAENLDAQHLLDFAHGDIAHSNRSNLDVIDQDLAQASSPLFSLVKSSNQATNNNELVRLDQMNSAIAGLDWQHSIIAQVDFTTPPVTPNEGDRYINTTTVGAYTENYIYEWIGAAWVEFIPNEGWTVWDESLDTNYTFNGTDWVEFGSTVSHNNTSGLQGGTTIEYYHLTSAQHTEATQYATALLNGLLTSTKFSEIGANTTANAGVVTVHSDVSDAGSGIIISALERTAIGTNTTNNSGVVTIHSDVTDAGSGIITSALERIAWDEAKAHSILVAGNPHAVTYAELSGGTPQLAVTKADTTNEYFNSYDAGTGAFTSKQVAYSEISGTPTIPAVLSGTSIERVAATSTPVGVSFWDTDLKIPCYLESTIWYNAAGGIIT